MLIASYVRGPDVETERQSGILGGAGGILGWFAVGCPVCNKIALLALGYTGALTYFALLQPSLAALSIVLLVVAVIIRLKGQYACPVPSSERSVRSLLPPQSGVRTPRRSASALSISCRWACCGFT